MDSLNKKAVAGLIMALIMSLSLTGIIYSQLEETRIKVAEINKRADNARAGELAGLSQLLDMNNGTKMIQSGLLAVEAGKYGASLQADQALRQYLNLAALPIAKVSFGDNTTVYVAYSPDGKYVVSGGASSSGGSSVRVWEAQSGRVIASMPFNSASSVAFSPDGKYVAAGGWNGVAQVWDAKSGREIISQTSGDSVSCVTFSPDGKYVAWSGEGTIRVWDIKKVQEVLQIPHRSVPFITFSPNGKHLLSSGYDRTARVWDIENGSEVLNIAHNGWVKKAIFSPDGKYITSASDDNMLRIWRADSGQVVFEKYNDSKVNDVAFSPDGQFLVAGFEKGTVLVWNVSYESEVARMTHRHSVNSVAFSPDGKYVASSSYGDAARIWVATTGQEIIRFADVSIGSFISTPAQSIAFSPDGKYIATGGCESLTYYKRGFVCEGVARVWEVSNGRQVFDIPQRNLQHDYGNIRSVTYSPLNSNHVLTGNSDGYARVWNIRNGQEVFRIKLGDDGNPVYAAFSSNGKYILAQSATEASVWDSQNGTEIFHKDHLESIVAMAFSPNSELVVSGSSDGTIVVWEAKSGREIVHMAQTVKRESLIFSPDGKYIAAIDMGKASQNGVLPKEGIVRIWEASSGQEITRITYLSQVDTIAFSPDSKHIALNGYSPFKRYPGIVSIREVPSGREITNYYLPEHVYSILFTADGKYIINGGRDFYGTVVIWDIQANHEVSRILTKSTLQALSPDERYLLSGPSPISVWDLQSNIMQIEDWGILSENLAFTTQRNYTQSKDEISRITSYDNAIFTKFSPDGRYILTTGCDFNSYGICNERHIFILYWRIEDLIAETCRRLPRNFTQAEWMQYFPDESYRATCPNLQVEP